MHAIACMSADTHGTRHDASPNRVQANASPQKDPSAERRPEHADAEERLRRFLQWRRDTGRGRPAWRPTGRQALCIGATVFLVGIAVASVVLTSPSRRDRVAAERPAPPEVPAAPAPPVTAADVPSPPPDDRVAARAAVPAPRESNQDPGAPEPALELPPRPPKRPPARRPADLRPPRARYWTLPDPQRSIPPAALVPPPAPQGAPADAAPGVGSTGPEEVPTAPIAPPPADAPDPRTAPAPSQPGPPPTGTSAPPPPRIRSSAPPRVTSAPARPAVAAPATAEPIEVLKHLVGYVPQVWLGRRVAAWVKTKPPARGGPRPEPEVVQAR
jgi:hypothetical protein